MMIGQKIKRLREQKGLTITELAARSGVSKSYISSMERDIKKNPSIEVLSRLSKVLQVEIGELVRE
ncbi:helix-turn-helix domain-containing protein [Metabacillus lacus]